MNQYLAILYQALESRLGLKVLHENPRSAIAQFRTQRKTDPILSCLRFFPDPKDPAGILIVKDPSRDPTQTSLSQGAPGPKSPGPL